MDRLISQGGIKWTLNEFNLIYKKKWGLIIIKNRKKKIVGQKFMFLAHSGGHEMVTIIFCLIFNHGGSKV